MAPIGPTNAQQCRALEAEWSQVCKRISDAHQQCLDAYQGSDVKGAGECSRGPCLSLHQQMTSCGGEERSRQVAACNASVREHQAREAEFQRAQEAAIRAEQEAERARSERLAAETARSNMEAELARQRTEEYRRRIALDVRPPEPRLADRQVRLVEDLRERAEAAADAARAIPDRIDDVVTAIGDRAAAVTESIRLDHTFTDIFDNFFPGVNPLGRYISKDSSTAVDDWGAVIDGTSAISGIADFIPSLRFPMGGHVGNIAQGIKDGNMLALNRLDSAVKAMLNGTPVNDNFYTTQEDALREFVRGAIPLGLIERLEQTTITFENGQNAIYRLFNP
jgi:hypothetical protein